MNYFGTERRVDVKTPFGIEDTPVDENQRRVAITVAAMLLGAAVLGALFGRAGGPELKPLLLVCATVWSAADLLVACIFLSQFYVSGRLFFGALSLAYGLACLLTWAYLAVVPGLFSASHVTGDYQVATLVWCTMHCTFPLLVALAGLNDAPKKRLRSRRAISIAIGVLAAAPFVLAGIIFAVIVTDKEALPPLVVDGTFQFTYRVAVLPTIAMLNAAACFCIFARRRELTPLMLWLGVATFSATLEALLVEASSTSFTYAADIGELMAVLTVSIVLGMFLCEMTGLYERLDRVARTDILASLDDRRAFDEHFAGIVHKAQRFQDSIALLLIDVDFFEQFNDTSGQGTPEACLRRVAHALAGCSPHPSALTPRYGKQEFAIVLPDAQLDEAYRMAESVRVAVENLRIPHRAVARGYVTVSVGLAYVGHALDAEAHEIFEAAERALFEAKDRGGDAVAGGPIEVRHAA